MRKRNLIVAFVTLVTGSLCFLACQKDEMETILPDRQDMVSMKTEIVPGDCTNHCIDPEMPNWLEKNDEKTVGWGGLMNDRFSKTVDISYYNTLDAFVLRVMSTENIANLLVDGNSVKDFSNPIPAGTWHEISLPLPNDWEACDDYNFVLNVIGNGPPVVFDVEYKLVGDCNIGPDAFITTWDTNLGEGTKVTLGLADAVNAIIFWGDGKFSHVNTAGPHTHEYGKDGIYTVKVTGNVSAYSGWRISDSEKLVSIDSWGDLGFTTLAWAFPGHINLISVPCTTNGLESVTNMGGMFWGATSFNHDIGGWDVSNVTIMMSMFGSASSFNQYIGDWNVSNVTNMNGMFNGATMFNQDIENWDVSNVEFMVGMFGRTEAFNQDIGGWDVSKVRFMTNMFGGATAFNQDLGGWDVSNVNVMSYMFDGATAFNQDISSWDVSNVYGLWYTWDGVDYTGMDYMFRNASSFNYDLSGWCVEDFQLAPHEFDYGATNWLLPRPVWGTCPDD